MNILVIPNNDWINHPVPAQRHYKIFNKLGRKHNVYVVQFDIFGGKREPTHIPEFTRIIRPFTIQVSDPAKFYLVNLPFHGKKIFSTIKELDIDIVFGSNLAICTLGFLAAKRLGVKSIFDLSDFFPASVRAYYPDANSLSKDMLSSLALMITKLNIKNADLCTTCSSVLKEYIQHLTSHNNVKHLPNGVDTEVFTPEVPSKNLKYELEIDDYALVYVGSLESWLDFDTVFNAISILHTEGVNVQLLIIGRSIYTDKDPVGKRIKEKGLEKQVKFLGFKPYETLPDFINLSIGGLIPFKTDSLLTQMAFPNKLIEYMACGKPVFAPPMRELKKVGGQYLHVYDDPKSLATQIKKVISLEYDPKEIQKTVLNYDWNNIASRLETYMLKILE